MPFRSFPWSSITLKDTTIWLHGSQGMEKRGRGHCTAPSTYAALEGHFLFRQGDGVIQNLQGLVNFFFGDDEGWSHA